MFTRIAGGLAALALAAAAAAQPSKEAPELPDTLPINHLQVLGTHNSYSAGIDPRLLAEVQRRLPSMEKAADAMPDARRALFKEEHPANVSFAEALSYRHPGLTEQLDLGVRSLEIDVNADPQGGAYADPAGYRLLRAQGVTDLLPFDAAAMRAPGFKVLHIPDIDFRSHCPTFRGCLAEIRTWSQAHPGHVPLFILVEAKVQGMPILPGATVAPPFTPAAFDALDREIVETVGRDRIITPDDVRGSHETLDEAVRAGGWPTLGKARGKMLFLMLTATGPGGASGYLAGHPGLRGRVAFLRAQPGEDHAAFLLLDNALVRRDEIAARVKQGYMVRTRSDIETFEAKTNDMTRANAAFASGAQIVSTDYEQPGNAYGTRYVVRLPGGGVVRCLQDEHCR